MYKFLQRRKAKQQRKLEEEFDRVFKQFMKEEMYGR